MNPDVEVEIPLLDSFRNEFTQIAEDSLKPVRAKAWDHFLEIGLPDKKTEVFRYIKIPALLSQSLVPAPFVSISPPLIETFVRPECRHSFLVFINGHYAPLFSNRSAIPNSVIIDYLHEANKTYNILLGNHWAKSISAETDPFAILNTALHKNGLFIYIPPKTKLAQTIQIVHFNTIQEPSFTNARLHIFAGAHSDTQFLITKTTEQGIYLQNLAQELFLEEGASISFMQTESKKSLNGWLFDSLRANLKKNSCLKTFLTSAGGICNRYDYKVSLSGENSEVSLNGLWSLQEKNECHVNVLVDHQSPYCRSMQLFKGVLRDASFSSFEGKILVRPLAQKTEAFQLNNNLLLSPGSQAKSKPNLEIYADDVKASHGATVGRLAQEHLFYLKSRGFTDLQAKQFLVHGFCKEIIDLMPLPSLQEELLNNIAYGP